VSRRRSLAVSKFIMKPLKRIPILVAAAACLLAQTVVAATNTAAPSARMLESLVSEWVKLRAEAEAEKRETRESELQWNEEIKLLETEKAELNKELADADAVLASSVEERAALLEDNRRMENALSRLEPVLDRAETELRRWRSLVPPSLSAETEPLFAKLGPPRSQAVAGVAERLQVVIGLYTQIENLQHGIHVGKEMPAIAGSPRRELDVLYLGLAAGFGVSPDNKAAAVGMLSAEGWTWKARDDLAPQVRRALNVFNRETAVRFVALPLTIESADGGEEP